MSRIESIHYQADADLNQAIVTGVLRREPTIDFQTVFSAGLEGIKDLEVLTIAAQQKRILISHDLVTTGKQCHQHLLNSSPIIRVQALSSFPESYRLKALLKNFC